MRRLCYIWLTCLLLGGCRTIDATKNRFSFCVVHEEPMTVEILGITSGFIGYTPEYAETMPHQFPNYSGVRWAHSDFHLGARKMKAYVCSSCTKAYKEYHRNHIMKQKAQQDTSTSDEAD